MRDHADYSIEWPCLLGTGSTLDEAEQRFRRGVARAHGFGYGVAASELPFGVVDGRRGVAYFGHHARVRFVTLVRRSPFAFVERLIDDTSLAVTIDEAEYLRHIDWSRLPASVDAAALVLKAARHERERHGAPLVRAA